MFGRQPVQTVTVFRVYSAGSKGRYRQEASLEMLTTGQQRTIDRFAKSLLTLGDDALIDTYHQGLGRSQSSSCGGQRQPQQGLREESCDRKGDERSLS